MNTLLIEGFQTTIIGMGIVFFVLITLSLTVSVFNSLMKSKDSNENAVLSKDDDYDAPVDDYVDDTELVAVISASIAYSLNTNVSNIKISSIRKVNANSKWMLQTRVEHQNNL